MDTNHSRRGPVNGISRHEVYALVLTSGKPNLDPAVLWALA